MQPHMVFLAPHLTPACQVRHVRVSLPLITALVDNRKYFPPDVPAACSQVIDVDQFFHSPPPRRPRAPHRRRPIDRDAHHAQVRARAEYVRLVALAAAGNAAAASALAKCHDTLGLVGTQLIRAVLIEGKSATSLAGPQQLEQRYFRRRLELCTNELAIVFGFATT